VPGIAARMMGSPDLYGHEEREPEQSINFVTCHDGFTLNDLVSFNHKHNEANGEANRDGADDNLSWNCGAEGETGDPAVEALRNRQVKNFFALTLLAAGTPMLLMGDEVRRTQHGNNNAYCQDGSLSWFDWSLLERHADVHRFVKLLNEFRQRRDVVSESTLTLNQLLQRARITWHGIELDRPDWSRSSHSFAFTLRTLRSRFLLHGMFNAYWEALTFELPPAPGSGRQGWRRCIDTVLPSPDDIQRWQHAPDVAASSYTVQPRSVAVLAMALTGHPLSQVLDLESRSGSGFGSGSRIGE
jgi:glycogen operon protein